MLDSKKPGPYGCIKEAAKIDCKNFAIENYRLGVGGVLSVGRVCLIGISLAVYKLHTSIKSR